MMNLMEKLLAPEAPWVYIVLCIGALLVQSLCVTLVRDAPARRRGGECDRQPLFPARFCLSSGLYRRAEV